MKTETINQIILKNPHLKNKRYKLEMMQPGNYCFHRSWGFGKIKKYNNENHRLIIKFETKKNEHAMDPIFCLSKLEILSHENLLVKKKTEPDFVDRLIYDQPTDLIVYMLSNSPNKNISVPEIERNLIQLIDPLNYKKWWHKTKKLLIRDPRISIPVKKSDSYCLRDKPISLEKELLKEFNIHKNPKKKILLAEKIYKLFSKRSVDGYDVKGILEVLSDIVKKTDQLSPSDQLHGIFVRDNLAGLLNEETNELRSFSSSFFIKTTKDLHLIAFRLPNSYLKKLLKLIMLVFPDEWKTKIINLLCNSDGRLTQECITFLYDNDCKNLLKNYLVRWLKEQTIKGPLIFWILKNRHSRKYSSILDGLIGPGLLGASLHSIDCIALHSSRSRRIPLVDLFTEDTNIIFDMLSMATQETAHALAQNLLNNQGFEQLTKRSILARFIKCFPTVQNLLTVCDSSKSDNNILYVSKNSFEKCKEEYEVLITDKIPTNKLAIIAAREHGDLKENSEYKMAKQDQDTLMARKFQLETDLLKAKITDFKETERGIVGIGSVVKLVEVSTGNVHTYSILGAWDSDPKSNTLSYKTPLGQSLIGKSIGDCILLTIGSKKERWIVEKIERWTDIDNLI